MQRIGDEPANIIELEPRQHDLMHPRIDGADRLQRPQKRVRGADLVVTVGPNQQQVPHLWMRDQVHEEVERRCIKPLQIVKKQGERMLLAREYAKEAPEHHLETVLRVLRRQLRQRPSSSSLSVRSGRTRLWNAWPRVAYGMSRLYWSNLPDANRPRGGTSALCSSFTTEDLPIPEYPETSTSSAAPLLTT